MRRTVRFQSLLFLAAMCGFGVVGCKKPGETPPAPAEVSNVNSAAEARNLPEPSAEPVTPAEESMPAEPAATAAEPTAPVEAAVATEQPMPEEPAAPAEAAESADGPSLAKPVALETEKVTLGDPSLTAGIPGDGTLKIEEIKAWLDKPENHVALDPILPLGLNKGQGAIKGIDKNPLTRAKIELGRQLYFDPRLSRDGTVSCASCHSPDEGYARHTQFGVGIDGLQGGRNSPISYNRILSDLQFWDGRAATLEEQAKGPIANPIEMDYSHEACVKALGEIEGYKLQFDKIFGELNIERVAEAIASFERSIVTGPSPFDYYEELRPFLTADLEAMKEDDLDTYALYEAAKAASDAHPMSESAIRGREIYFTQKGNCSACHVGPNLTDELYYNIGVGMDKPEPDLGRYAITQVEKDKGAFKTPTVRNVALSAPYMHDGSQKTLAEVVEWYNKGGHKNDWLSDRIKPLNLTDQEKQDLVAFMEACTGDYPQVTQDRLPE